MKLQIIFPVNPSEPSTHLRRGLYKLFTELGYKLHGSSDEWDEMHIEGPAPSEQLVDSVFNNFV